MRAVVQDGFGGTEQLDMREVPEPVPGEGEVLVRVQAAGVDRGTWHLLSGLPYLGRPFFGIRSPRFPVVGREVAGTVVAHGPGVDPTDLPVGTPVIGTAGGSCAELAVVPMARIARAPRDLAPEQAAALPVSGLTALQAVRRGDVGPGSRVLVIGASGGVGSYAVQVAAAAGAEVTGVCSAAKADLVRDLGARHVVDYRTAEPGADGSTYDLVLDVAGNRPLRVLRRLLTPSGTLVIVGGEEGGPVLGGVQRQLWALLWSPFLSQRLTSMVASESADDLAALVALVDAGDVRAPVARTVDLAETAEALDLLAAGEVRGKVTVRV
ncbi:MAG: NAD(P)-dependent alcohol dehydrogenase [Nocardioides sp.]|nr:NAD(P)-dependent alcohol dehydrogenase [Nocardioides sp.]